MTAWTSAIVTSYTGRSSDIDLVSEAELLRLWDENHVSEKRAAGLLIESIARETPAADPALPAVVGRIIKLETPVHRRHIGTLHEVVDRDGNVLHSHPKDYTRRDCTRVRT
jgi:hypothetical protein